MDEAEKRLVSQLGAKVCIYTKVCLHHAEKASRNKVKDRFQIDWDEIFRWANIFRTFISQQTHCDQCWNWFCSTTWRKSLMHLSNPMSFCVCVCVYVWRKRLINNWPIQLQMCGKLTHSSEGCIVCKNKWVPDLYRKLRVYCVTFSLLLFCR